MKKTLILLILTLCGLIFCSASFFVDTSLFAGGVKKNSHHKASINDRLRLQSGDIIFQVTNSRQCKAIQHATGSKYSHVGIIFNDDGFLYVMEAVQPVQAISLDDFIDRGVDGHYVVKRLKSDQLTKETLNKMEALGRSFIGTDYDLTFEWSDDRMYCSELVWKMYERVAGIEIGKLRPLKDFDLSHPLVKTIMKERYGKMIPVNERMISPGDMFESELLETVASSQSQ